MSETAKASAVKGARGPNVEIMRSQLGRVRGLGAGGTGTSHWWAERLTSVALVPLTLYFVYAAFHLARHPRIDVAHWFGRPWNTTLMLALVAITFHHMQAGLQVVIDDYIHVERTRMALLILNKGAAALLGLACVVATLKLAFTA